MTRSGTGTRSHSQCTQTTCGLPPAGVYYATPVLTGNLRHFEGLGGLRLIDGS
jgi:hypothetical protein